MLGVAVNVMNDDPPAQMGLVPLTAIETVGAGLTVRIKKSDTSGQDTFPGC